MPHLSDLLPAVGDRQPPIATEGLEADLVPGGYWRLLYSARSTIRITRSASSGRSPLPRSPRDRHRLQHSRPGRRRAARTAAASRCPSARPQLGAGLFDDRVFRDWWGLTPLQGLLVSPAGELPDPGLGYVLDRRVAAQRRHRSCCSRRQLTLVAAGQHRGGCWLDSIDADPGPGSRRRCRQDQASDGKHPRLERWAPS